MEYDFSWNSWKRNVNFFKIDAIKTPFKDLLNVSEALVSLFELLKCDSRLILCKRPFLKKSWLQREIWGLTKFLFCFENFTYLAGQEREQQLQKAEIPRISKQLFDLLYRSRLNFNVCSKFCSDFIFDIFEAILAVEILPTGSPPSPNFRSKVWTRRNEIIERNVTFRLWL